MPRPVSDRKPFSKTLHVCDGCKPDPSKRPESMRKLPFFCEIKPIARFD